MKNPEEREHMNDRGLLSEISKQFLTSTFNFYVQISQKKYVSNSFPEEM